MKENTKFYRCPICGNVIGLIDGDITHITCCGQIMEKLEANVADASVEKHVPIYERMDDEILVKVGEIEHPMEKDHYIMWVALVSETETTRIRLFPEQGTDVRFRYIPGSTIYAYCNKHGLWKKDVE